MKLAEGTITRARARSGFQVGVRIVVPPFPYKDKQTFESSSKDAVILFKTASREGYHIEDVRQENGEWLVTGTSGVVLIACGTGPTMKQAQRQAYNRVRNVMIPNMYYREDIGDRWSEEDSDRLHSWGYSARLGSPPRPACTISCGPSSSSSPDSSPCACPEARPPHRVPRGPPREPGASRP